MKSLVLSLALFFMVFTINAQEDKGITITVTIDNVTSDQGKVLAAIHTPETFMRGPGVLNAESEISEGKVKLTFENVSEGTYAIMAMHDVNNNKQMDFEANGMPKESYGMSGNDMTMGPPNFEMAKFDVADKDLEFNIRF
ncbi:DUF2141 domain-containing protein [Croceivirga thetidis]|uniref:DUF2141 domain-containing protein n=1 Tax=Croceivirga thetidis TaxID=2721623 RepID=A0ABX1GS27_9FLAO|nr:DUF2141 domain-containing protein [Croceivirga thetidis]NKI32752.1 DUF2141 domain-containing protein [Croceivirga thetidis]